MGKRKPKILSIFRSKQLYDFPDPNRLSVVVESEANRGRHLVKGFYAGGQREGESDHELLVASF
jgi:hypothetical protein